MSIFFLSNCFGQQIKEDSLHNLMRGEWYSLDDSSYHIVFLKYFVREWSKGSKGVTSLNYSIQKHSCDSMLDLDKGTGYYLVEVGKDKSMYCYIIRDISKDYLELVYAGGRTLYFRKVRDR
jgi:hypothetical protein